MSRTPSVAAVVLNYNGKDVTLEALKSLTAMDYPAYHLVVVDNGSTDGSYEAIAERYPQVAQVRTEENLGPAGGANLGIRWALDRGHDYVMLLNNDIEVEPPWLGALVEALTHGCMTRVALGTPYEDVDGTIRLRNSGRLMCVMSVPSRKTLSSGAL